MSALCRGGQERRRGGGGGAENGRSVNRAFPVYALDGAIAGKVTFCGYLCADEEDPAKAPMREELRRATDKLVVVTAGGGYDAYPMMRACLDAFRLVGKDLPFEAIVITGPPGGT